MNRQWSMKLPSERSSGTQPLITTAAPQPVRGSVAVDVTTDLSQGAAGTLTGGMGVSPGSTSGQSGQWTMESASQTTQPNAFYQGVQGTLRGAIATGGARVGIPQGWRDDGSRLIAPNGIPVVLGFRWYILTHPWASDNWPLEPDHYATHVDFTQPVSGGGTVQHFRSSILIWKELNGDIVELWAGAEALALYQRVVTDDAAFPARSAAMVGASATVGATSLATRGGTTLVAPTFTPASTAQGSRAGSETVSQRLSTLEHQVQVVIQGLSKSPKTRDLIRTVGQDAADIGDALIQTKGRRGGLPSAGWIIRLILMILGLLFSDIAAWFLATFAHQSSLVPIPFLTVGTVVSGIAVLSAFRKFWH